MIFDNEWTCAIEDLIAALDNDAVVLARTYPFVDLSQVQHYQSPSPCPGIKAAYLRSFNDGSPQELSPLVDSVALRLERDENALNWIFHHELVNGNHVAGNDENLIALVKAMPTKSKLAIITALTSKDSEITFKGLYLPNLDEAICNLSEFCGQQGMDKFKILPTDSSLLDSQAMTIGAPGMSSITHDASSVRSLPKTILINACRNLSWSFLVTPSTKAIANEFPMATAHKQIVLDELLAHLHLSTNPSQSTVIRHRLDATYKGTLSFEDLTAPSVPVLGGWFRHRRPYFVQFQKKLLPEYWDREDRACMMRLVGELYGMGGFREIDLTGYPDKPADHVFVRELASTPGLPAINNFIAGVPETLSVALIDQYLDQFGLPMVITSAHQYKGEEMKHYLSHDFLRRLALGSTQAPSNLFYEYGLTKLALLSKQYLADNLGIEDIPWGLDEFCYALGLDALPVDERYHIARRQEVYDLLPSGLKTTENKLLMGLRPSTDELEQSSESLQERALYQDLGL